MFASKVNRKTNELTGSRPVWASAFQLFRRIFVLLLTVLVIVQSNGAAAQSVSIIRDAEVETLIRDFARPLFKAAGIPNADPDIFLVADRRFNAFVTESGNIFVNYGTIIQVKTPSALKAVLAHEIGHLAGGHVARLREQTEINGRLQIVAMLLGVGAVAAAAGSGNTGELGEMASAFILASQSVGNNSLMAYRRSEESAADAAGVKLLTRAGQSTKGMVDVLRTLGENQLARSQASPYLRSHPLADDRLAQIEPVARASATWGKKDSRADITALALAQAKLVGYLDSRETVLNRYPNSDKSNAARYARIITAYRAGAAIGAIKQMPNLISAAPRNPYFRELLGQMYFETGKAEKALPHLKKAVSMAPDQPEIRTLYGLALIDAGGTKNLKEAVTQLNRVAREARRANRAFYLLSRAYGGLGENGKANLAAAEAALARGDIGLALGLARKAQQELNASTPAWLRADDILSLN